MTLPSAGRQCVIAVMVACGQKLLCVFTLQKETPLANAVFWAARKGNLALLQLLLNSGRVDADCRDSVRSLHHYCMCRLTISQTIFNDFFQQHINWWVFSVFGFSVPQVRIPFSMACTKKRKDCWLIHALLMFFCSVFIPQYGTTALMVASYSGHYECVKELIMQGADINYQRQVQLVTGLVSDNTSAHKLLCVQILITSMRWIEFIMCVF